MHNDETEELFYFRNNHRYKIVDFVIDDKAFFSSLRDNGKLIFMLFLLGLMLVMQKSEDQ